MSQREARKQILLNWLNNRDGEVPLLQGKCPPGMSLEQSHLAATDLAADGQAIITFYDGKSFRVVTRISLEHGIKQIRTSLDRGEMPTGVSIPLGAMGNQQVIARESEQQIQRFEEMLEKL